MNQDSKHGKVNYRLIIWSTVFLAVVLAVWAADPLYVIGNANITGNLTLGDNANVSGTVSADAFIGDGSQLTGLSSGSSNWNVSGSNLFPASLGYNVGVGTDSPNEALTVIGNINLTGYLTCSFAPGLTSPIPTLPLVSIYQPTLPLTEALKVSPESIY